MKNKLICLKINNYLRWLETELRKTKDSSSFQIFFSRLASCLISQVSSLICDFRPVQFSPLSDGRNFDGCILSSKIAVVSIMRGGDALVEPFQKMLGPITVGKIGIDNQKDNKEIIYSKLPQNLEVMDKIILVDVIVNSGQTVEITIKHLLNKKIKKENIIFFCVFANYASLKKIANKLGVVCIYAFSEDVEKNQRLMISDVGDLFYGTNE